MSVSASPKALHGESSFRAHDCLGEVLHARRTSEARHLLLKATFCVVSKFRTAPGTQVLALVGEMRVLPHVEVRLWALSDWKPIGKQVSAVEPTKCTLTPQLIRMWLLRS